MEVWNDMGNFWLGSQWWLTSRGQPARLIQTTRGLGPAKSIVDLLQHSI